MHSHNQVVPGATIEQIKKMRTDFPGRGPHTLTGPIYVEGAEPGDVLKVQDQQDRAARLCDELQRAGHVRAVPEGISGRPGQISLSRPRPHGHRVPARRLRFRCGRSPERSASRARSRANTAPCRPASTPATWTSAISSRARRSMCRCTCRARCCGPAIPTPRRATARSTSPRSRPPTANSTSRSTSSRASRSTCRASRRRRSWITMGFDQDLNKAWDAGQGADRQVPVRAAQDLGRAGGEADADGLRLPRLAGGQHQEGHPLPQPEERRRTARTWSVRSRRRARYYVTHVQGRRSQQGDGRRVAWR